MRSKAENSCANKNNNLLHVTVQKLMYKVTENMSANGDRTYRKNLKKVISCYTV